MTFDLLLVTAYLISGALMLFLGFGLSFVFGPVGLLLMFGGVVFIVWGALISWLKKAK